MVERFGTRNGFRLRPPIYIMPAARRIGKNQNLKPLEEAVVLRTIFECIGKIVAQSSRLDPAQDRDATGVNMGLEGIYRLMAFLPSKRNPKSPVANRYFGIFKNGKIKARGLSFRRSDTPPLIQEAQVRMVEVLAEAKDVEEYR